MDAADLRLDAPFVAFVGAGASAIEPSHLPTWSTFNGLVLDALCQPLDQFSRDRQPTSQMLQTMLARRDQTRYLTPDFQAQLIEEEVVAEDFGVWQSLPATAFSPVHAALAVLARQGRLAAIVTTNSDTLIEATLDELDVLTTDPYRGYCPAY
jgi:NAD-dependent SIR2 family protein deacetylase